MRKIAVKMLLGDRAKYLGLVFGVTFATLLMSQQVSLFIGVMGRVSSFVFSIDEADIWVMDPRVRYVEEVEPMRDSELQNVRSVEGIAWAVPIYKGLSTIRMPDGLTQQVQLIGVDDVTQVGLCNDFVMGDGSVLRRPQQAIMDRGGYRFTWPGQPLALGKQVELNDNRLTIAAICDVMPTFFTFPIMYVSYNTAMEITPGMRKKMPFILVKARAGQDIPALIARITQQTGLQALTRRDFAWRSMQYMLERTAVPINFGLTILLGIIVGAAVTAQTFYIFVIENLKQFAAMKAIGVTNGQLLRIVLTQAAIIGVSGYGLGIGATALFFAATKNTAALKGFMLHWQVMAGAAVIIALIILFSIAFSLRKVFKVDPAIVFRG